jgi:ankyrin repeat protein
VLFVRLICADMCALYLKGLAGESRIRYTEFIAATIEAHGRVAELNLAEAFDCLDCDDSGFISANDLMEILGSDIPQEEVDDIIAEISPTKDGSISYSDFLALWEGDILHQKKDQGAVGHELSSITPASSTQDEAHAAFLKGKHHQNTLHAWAIEMQLPVHEFVKGCNFLHLVALRNKSDLENMLKEQPALVNFRDYDRRTPLHIAASEGFVDICKFLITKGARINRNDRWGGSPMDDAYRHGHTDVINLLREHQGKFGSTSQIANLITASSEGNVKEVKTLLELGSLNLDKGDYDHRTALHLAASEGHVEVVKLLVDAGANVKVKDRWGSQPVDGAKKAKKNSKEVVKILLGTTVDYVSHVNGEDHEFSVTCSREVDVTDEGATEFAVDEFGKGCSLLHQVALGNQLVLEKMVLECPALINFRDYDRRTPLHIAASEGHVNICRYLVENGGMVNRCDRWGGSPLDDAHREQHLDVAKFLQSKGAKFGSTSHVTNFISAASAGDIDEVKAFLDFGKIDLNEGDYDKRTALHLAAGEGHLNIVRTLCEAGANTNVEDRWGHRPIDDASGANRNSNEIMRLLLTYGAESTSMVTKIRTAFIRSFMPK